MSALAGLVVGFAGALLLLRWPVKADWLEAVGTWFGALVTASAVIVAIVAFRSEEFARRLEQAQASRAERARLQEAADLVTCSIGWGVGKEFPPGIITPSEVRINAKSGSSYVVMDVNCEVPQLDASPMKLADVLQPGEEVPRTVPVTKPFEVHTDNREFYESTRFTFSLGRVRWSTRYGQLADRLDM